MNDRDSAYSDQLFGSAIRMMTAGVDPDLASETVADALGALAKQAKALKAVEYSSEVTKRVPCECGLVVEVKLPNASELAKAMSQTAKMIDETARLTQFVTGKADSRPDLSGMPVDVLKALNDAQLAQVMSWVQESMKVTEG